jgi:hypothetical protein
MVKFCNLFEKKKLFLERELPLTLTQNYGWWPHAFFIFFKLGVSYAHSVKKRKLKYNEVDQTPSLSSQYYSCDIQIKNVKVARSLIGLNCVYCPRNLSLIWKIVPWGYDWVPNTVRSDWIVPNAVRGDGILVDWLFITSRQEAVGLFIWKFYVLVRLCGAKVKAFKFPKNIMESWHV